MIEINLVPDVKQELIRAQRTRSMVISVSIIVGLASIAIVVALALYIYTVQAIRGGLADNEITKKSETLSKVEDLSKILTVQNQLEKISDIYANKKINSRIFDVLIAIIPPAPNNIQISVLQINSDDNTISIEGQAANSYAAVELFKKTIDGTKIKYNTNDDKEYKKVALASNVDTKDTSYGADSSGVKVLRFTVTFTYADELFSNSSKNVLIVVANKGNVTDSYLGIPKSIFVDRAKDLEEDK